MGKRKILVADLLCGAGGSSTGCERALNDLGLEMELVCVNHWPLALETHALNHPRARHVCGDIATVRPHILVPEGYLDLLMASPTCTHHSVARGGKPTSDQQRSDPWHIITWLTELRVKRLIIENVWEFISWGPVDPRTGKPIQSRKGEYFKAWIDTIRRLGFEPEWRKLNAADYGDATTRQRFILMARSDKKSVSWPIPTHHKAIDGKLALFPGMKPWKPAREIIDWDIKGRSIFGRKKPLADKTLARIYAGAVKFAWPEPFLVILRNHMAGQSIDGPLPALTAGGTHVGLAQPIIMKQNFRRDTQGVDQPAPTIMTEARIGVVEPIIGGNRTNNTAKSLDNPVGGITTATGGGQFLAEPVILSPRHGKEGAGPRPRAAGQPLPTITGGGSQFGVAEPVIVNMKGQSTAGSVDAPLPTQTSHAGHVYLAEPFIMAPGSSGAPRETGQPLPTITTGGAGAPQREGCARPMLIEPFVVTVAHGNSPGDPTADERRAHSVEQPLGAIHAGGGKFAAVEPFVLSRHGEGAPRSIDEPTPTQVAKHSHVLISPYYGSGSGETCKSAQEPLDTVTSKGRFGMVVPVTHSQGGNGARDVAEPIPTCTTAKGGEFAIVMPVTHHDASDRTRDPEVDPLQTVTGANRGELAFIAAQFGEREGQAPRVHDVEQPTPAICATGHINLVEATPEYDILFRMLEPHELAAAMGFDDEEAKYEFAGNKTQRIKQIGNAVSVAKMKACVSAMFADAAVKQEEKPVAAKRATA